MIFISQGGLTAIDQKNILFFVISSPNTQEPTFKLLAKTPAADNNFYDYLILFQHENVEVVKHVMRFLANGVFLSIDNSNLLVVDLPDLYQYGLPKINFTE